MNTSYIIAHADYLTALSYDSVTDDIRQNFISEAKTATSEEHNIDTILNEIAFVYMCQVRNYGMPVSEAVNKIKTEFNYLGMNAVYGDFDAYKKFVEACVEVFVSEESVIEKHDKFIPLATDSQVTDAVRYATGMTILRHVTKSYIMTGKIALIKEIMEVVRSYDEEPAGANAMLGIISEATQKDKADMIR